MGALTTILSLPRWVHIAAGVVALCLSAFTLHRCSVDDAREEGKSTGATAQREADLQETLERTEQGNEARNEIRDDVGTARYDQCLRTARTPANCERFLPRLQAPVR